MQDAPASFTSSAWYVCEVARYAFYLRVLSESAKQRLQGLAIISGLPALVGGLAWNFRWIRHDLPKGVTLVAGAVAAFCVSQLVKSHALESAADNPEAFRKDTSGFGYVAQIAVWGDILSPLGLIAGLFMIYSGIGQFLR